MTPSGSIRIGILAGEASGDILGSRLLAALHQRFETVEVQGIGGPLMEAQGLKSLFPMERLSVMGLVEPLKRLPELLRIRRTVRDHFLANPPDVFLGIDSPDFNLTLERQLRKAGIKTAHLVGPSVWAWRQRRIHKIKKSVDLMLCLFPFETEIYQQHGIPVRFVGHPLADEIPDRPDAGEARRQLDLNPPGPLLALLPGSRGGEVRLLAPLFLEVARRLYESNHQLTFVLPAANSDRKRELATLLAEQGDLPITLVEGNSRTVMAAADAIVLASGTATLEAALYKRPMVVAYRMAAFSWFLISRMVKSEFAALPNILAGRRLVPELLQQDATVDNIAQALTPLLDAGSARQQQTRAFDAIQQQLRRDSAWQTAQAIAELAGK
jgi:lipid-A-disaccharide synthase